MEAGAGPGLEDNQGGEKSEQGKHNYTQRENMFICLKKGQVIRQHMHQQSVWVVRSKDTPGHISFKASNTGQMSPWTMKSVPQLVQGITTFRQKSL